jgi:putative hemin transport protein
VQAFDELRERVAAVYARSPGAMTVEVARNLGVPEVEVVRRLPSCVELEAGRWESILRALPELGKVFVLVTNAAATLETVGTFGGFGHYGPYFNVQSGSLDLHLRPAELAAVFAVEKPGHLDRVPTLSFQFFTTAGASAIKVFLTFGGKPATPDRVAIFEKIRDAHRPGYVATRP